MTTRLRRARARLAIGAGAAGLALASSFALAPVAGAQATEAPQAETPPIAARFDAGVAALLRALDDAQAPAAAPVAAPAAKDDRTATTPKDDRIATAGKGCRDAGPADADVPRMVAEIFACRTLEAGGSHDEARRVAAEAVTVAACESAFKKKAIVFDGKYLDTPHPRTGYRYSAAGVFQFIRTTADKWIEPDGYASALRPRRNIDAAARLYLHNRASGLRGWEDWACAAVSDGFQDHSVLPGWPGGPAELPGWSWKLADAALA